VISIAALSGPYPKLGVIVVGLLAAAVLIGREEKVQAWAALGALILSPILLLVDIWHSPQLGIIHRHPLEAVIGGAVVLAILAAAAVVIARHPRFLGPLAMIALPFRIPIDAGGTTSNLLVPLYFVVAAAALAWIAPTLWGERFGARPPMADAGGQQAASERGSAEREAMLRRRARATIHLFERVLGAYIVIYAVQAIYSVDFPKALQEMVFFYVPFALLLRVLRRLDWDRALLVRCLQVTIALAIVFACIGFVEYDTKTLLLNPKLIATDNVHTYFTVNSVFFDPDIFGRYLALVMICLAATLLYVRRRRTEVLACVALAILWGGLVLTLSRSSLGALLLGLATLAALRWRARPVLVLGGVVILVGLAAVAVSPRTFGLNQGLNGASSGRASLITGGIKMFGDRPIWGYGSGSFSTEYIRQNPAISATLSDSHTIPITIAAEQGLIGEIVYLVLVVTAVLTLLTGARRDVAAAAIAAAFLALLLHTMLYADFLEDPLSWTLLGIGGALAARRAVESEEARRAPKRRRPAGAGAGT
jgi:putative inorganic carbon (HCO3(-)) transporter